MIIKYFLRIFLTLNFFSPLFVFSEESAIPSPERFSEKCYLPSINKFTIFPESRGVYVEYSGFFQSPYASKDFCIVLPLPSGAQDISLFNASEILLKEENKLFHAHMVTQKGIEQLHGGFFLYSELGEVSWSNDVINKTHAAFFMLIPEYKKGVTKNFFEKLFNYVNIWPPTVILKSDNLKTFVTNEPFGMKKDKAHHLDTYRMVISAPSEEPQKYPSFFIKGLYFDEFYFLTLLLSFIVLLLCVLLFFLFKRVKK